MLRDVQVQVLFAALKGMLNVFLFLFNDVFLLPVCVRIGYLFSIDFVLFVRATVFLLFFVCLWDEFVIFA